MLSEATKREIEAVRRQFSEHPRSALLPALRAAQRQYRYLTSETIEELAALLDVSPNALYTLATFYGLLYLEPVGRFVIQVCDSLSCYLLGGEGLREFLEGRLGIKAGQTTPDGLFTLRAVPCLASCGTAPVMMVNEDYYENMTKEKIEALLAELRARGAADV